MQEVKQPTSCHDGDNTVKDISYNLLRVLHSLLKDPNVKMV